MNLRAVKYWQVFVTEVKTLSEYNAEFFLKLIRQPMKIILLIVFWKVVFELTGKEMIAGLSQGEFITYILVASTIAFSFHPWTIAMMLDEQVKRGTLSMLLTKPISHRAFVMTKSLIDPVVDLLLPLPFLLLVVSFGWFGVQYVVPSLPFMALSVLSFILASYIALLTYYVVAMMIFWVGDLWTIVGTLEGMQVLLAGQAIPLTISPILHTIANFTPFPSMIFIPSFIFIEKFTIAEALQSMGVQFAWIVGLTLLGAWLWKQGLKKFDAQGG